MAWAGPGKYNRIIIYPLKQSKGFSFYQCTAGRERFWAVPGEGEIPDLSEFCRMALPLLPKVGGSFQCMYLCQGCELIRLIQFYRSVLYQIGLEQSSEEAAGRE